MKMTFGYELELGDVLRDRKLPERFGDWEYAETDIVNLYPPYQYVATDPLGKEPPVGGEINIRPGHTVEEVADRVCETIQWFRDQGDSPTASCVNHGHVHVRVIGLRDDWRGLRRLAQWIKENQGFIIQEAYDYRELPEMAKTRTARTYLKWDGGRPMPDWMADNIISSSRSFEDFIRLQCCGKDGRSRGRPFRYALNTYCMKHTDTIETRCLRASLKYQEIYDSLRFARDWVSAAIGETDYTAQELFFDGDYQLPPFYYDHAEYLGWECTKWGKERGNKERRLYDI